MTGIYWWRCIRPSKMYLNYFNSYRNAATNLLTNTPGWEISDYPGRRNGYQRRFAYPAKLPVLQILENRRRYRHYPGYTPTDATNYNNTADNVNERDQYQSV